MLPMYSHQEYMANFLASNKRMLNTSDPGTGKTRGTLEGFNRTPGRRRMLVVAPLSILTPSWGMDITQFCPDLTWAVAHGTKKEVAFTEGADIVLINHDGVKWLAKNLHLLSNFSHLTVDEFTAFKNRTAQRSKAVNEIVDLFEYVNLLSGTPNSNTVLDVWYPVYLLDRGHRLGRSYFGFRQQVCSPQQVGPRPEMIQWRDKIGAEQYVADQLKDITVRFKFEDCIDIPPNVVRFIHVELPAQVRKQYEELANASTLNTADGQLTAIHAGARVKKLLQMLTGAVYDQNGRVLKVHEDRYQLVMDLVEQRKQTVVAFNWQHEKDALVRIAEARGVTWAAIDGTVPLRKRTEAVNAFQNGELQVMFVQPQSAAHGLTLTAGTATIWCSPTYNSEHFQQTNRRIYRAGQRHHTETICVAALGTKEMDVYEKLNGKLQRMEDLLALFSSITKAA